MPHHNDPQGELGLRIRPAERQALLRSLTNLVTNEYRNIEERRKHNRYVPLHSDAIAELDHPGGSKVSCATLIYDISRKGIGFATRSFIHLGTPITIELRTTDGEMTKVSGRINRCEYYDNRFHRVGVEILGMIDPQIYVSDDEWQRHTSQAENKSWMVPRKALHLESDKLASDAIEMMLANTKFGYTNVSTIGEILDEAQKNSYDLILLSDSIGRPEMLEALSDLQSTGYAGALIVLASTQYDCDETLSELGVRSVLIKPVLLSILSATLRDIFSKQGDILNESVNIYTTLDETQCTTDQLIEFLQIVRNLSNQLNAYISNDNFPKALSNCVSLHSAGAGFGYPTLSMIASEAVQSLNASCSVQESASEVRKLIRVIARLHPREGFEIDNRAA